MANYYNNPWTQTYPMYQGTSASVYGQPMTQQPAPIPQPANQQVNPMMAWVDGEYAARSFQVPANHPLGQPYPIWDNSDTVIYLKTIDQFGRPMPLQKLRYTIEEERPKLQASGDMDTSQFVTKTDLEDFKNELRKMLGNSGPNQNNQNRGNGGKQQ